MKLTAENLKNKGWIPINSRTFKLTKGNLKYSLRLETALYSIYPWKLAVTRKSYIVAKVEVKKYEDVEKIMSLYKKKPKPVPSIDNISNYIDNYILGNQLNELMFLYYNRALRPAKYRENDWAKVSDVDRYEGNYNRFVFTVCEDNKYIITTCSVKKFKKYCRKYLKDSPMLKY